MFEIGDKVVHPHHGAGIVVGIEMRAISDHATEYYVIELAAGNRTLMIPVANAKHIGLRKVVKKSQLAIIRQALSAKPDSLPDDFKKRQEGLSERLKSGSLLAVAEVVRNLFWRDRVKKLSPSDMQMLDRAKEMLASELALAQSRQVDEVMEHIDATLEAGRSGAN